MKTSTINICLCRPNFKVSEKDYNLVLMESYINKFPSGTFDLFVFPEICIAGGFAKNGNEIYNAISERIPEGLSTQRVINLSVKYKTHICAGTIESSNNKYYATHFITGPNGFIGKQKKLFPLNPLKTSVLSSGKNVNSISLFNKKIVILPCSDILLPEPFMQSGIIRPALVLCPMDTFESNNKYTLDAILKARAIELAAPILAVFSKSRDKNTKVIDYILYDAYGTKIKGESFRNALAIKINLNSALEKWGGFIKRREFLDKNV